MKWNRIESKVVGIVDYDSYITLESHEIDKNEWNEFLKQFEVAHSKMPTMFIMGLLYEPTVGELQTIELNNNQRIKVKVVEVFKEGENTALVTTNF